MKLAFLLILLLNFTVIAQENFEIKNASKNYDVKGTVEECENKTCKGKLSFSIYRKRAKKPFQIIYLKNTHLSLSEENQLDIFKIKDKSNGIWSDIYIEDFNFDGNDDIALVDGLNGGYRGESYVVYLYSPKKNKFVYNRNFTRLTQGPYIGIFETERKDKTLTTFWKSGCCMHSTEKYKLVNNRPKKVKEVNEYRNPRGDNMIEIETKKLIKGRWRIWIKHIPITE